MRKGWGMKKNLKLIRLFSLIVFFLQPALTRAQNLNNRQRFHSTLVLQSTAIGQQLTRHFADFDDTVAHVTFGDVDPNNLYEMVNESNGPVLRLSGHLLAATY